MAFTLDAGDVLLSIAEIAVAFAGFSSIVAIFQRGSGADGGSFPRDAGRDQPALEALNPTFFADCIGLRPELRKDR